MFQVYPDEGLTEMLRLIVDNGGSGLTWRLYGNNIAPENASVLTDFTLLDSSWAQAIRDSTDFILAQVMGGVGTIQALPIVYTNTEGVPRSAYGFVIYNAMTSKLYAGSRFDDAPRVLNPGESTSVQVILGDYSESLIPVIDGGEF